MLVLTGALKVVANGSMAKEFPFVPKWSWRFIGAYEIYAAYLCHTKGQWELALPLVYAFFGGVLYCCSSLEKFLVIPFPLLNVAANCIDGMNNGVDTSAHIVPYLAAGYIFSFLLVTIFGGKAKGASKRKSN